MKFLSTITRLLIFALVSSATLNAQTKEGTVVEASNYYADVLPPSPTAAELGKYGLVPRVLSSGVPSIDIPLYNYSASHLKIPISISYHSSGVKVDQQASWVGTGWSLNAGGVVTRVVKGLSDDDYKRPYPIDFSNYDPESMDYIDQAMEGTIDTEPDLFAFNFMGYTGKFVFDHEGRPRIMPHQNLRIERTIDQASDLSQIKIITPDGVQYFFGGTGATETTLMQAAVNTCPVKIALPEETAWYLYKIVHPTGETINLTYHSYNYDYEGSDSNTYRVNIWKEGCPTAGGGCAQETISSCTYRFRIQAVRLAGIASPNHGSVEFSSTTLRKDLSGDYELGMISFKNPNGEVFKTFKFKYEYSTNPRLFLTGLEESSSEADSSPMQGQKKVHSFEYEDKNALPIYLSKSKDHWGYFNGANNQYLFPKENLRPDLFGDLGGDRNPNAEKTKKGILKKITYPTGGQTNFNYEQNTVWGEKLVKSGLTAVRVGGNGGEGEFGWQYYESTITFSVEQVVKVIGGYSYDPKISDACLEEKAYADFSIYNSTDGKYIEQNVRTKGYEKDIILEANKEYKFTTRVKGQCTAGSIYFTYYKSITKVLTNLITGGLRIGTIANYDPVTNSSETTKYHYGSIASLTKSSAVVARDPSLFYYSTSEIIKCSDPTCLITCKDGILHSSSLADLYGNGSGHIAYEYVTISNGLNFENGGEEYKFIINSDYSNRWVRGDEIKGTPYTNYGWNHGLEKAVRKFKKNSSGDPVIVYEKINGYKADSRYYVEVPALVIKKQVEGGCYEKAWTITCDGTEKKTYSWVCTVAHKHNLLLTGTSYGTLCIRSDANNVEKLIWSSPCNGKAAGTKISILSNLDNLNVMEYHNISYWHYLDSTTETYYDGNGNRLPFQTTYYSYDNPTHLQLTSVKSTTSRGEAAESRMYYPDDYTASSLAGLKEKFIVGIPIKKEQLVGGKQAGGQVYVYNEFGKPTNIYQYVSPEVKAPAPHDPSQVSLTDYSLEASISYDAQTQLVKLVDGKNGVSSLYLWGYNKTKPIAEVKNALANEVFHTSFEEAASAIENVNLAKTGTKYWSGSYTVNLPKAGEFILSYWERTSSTEWVLQERKVSSNATIGGSGKMIDEVRLYPEGCLMQTFTYKGGMETYTVTDSNNQTFYYFYDDMNRLSYIKDEKGDVVKSLQYRYMNRP